MQVYERDARAARPFFVAGLNSNALAHAERVFHRALMNLPAFWTRGEHEGFQCWRWSEVSLDQARSLADVAARRLAERFRSGASPSVHGDHADWPFRAPVLREIRNGNKSATPSSIRKFNSSSASRMKRPGQPRIFRWPDVWQSFKGKAH